MLRLNVIRIGFLMGVSLLLGAIVYFFASNWGGMDRTEKIITSAGLVFLFYGVSYTFSRFKLLLGHHHFLSNLFLVAGCLSFGAAVALLYQIYNAHADSFELFAVWSIPALLLAWITRYNPFYVLAFALIHLSLWFYFFPSSLYVVHSDEQLMMIGGLFALINLVLFILTVTNKLLSVPLKIISFIIFHVSLLTLTNSFEFERYGVWMNILCLMAIGIGFYYFSRVRLDKTMLTLHALATSAFAVFKFIELVSRHGSITFFILGILFVALLLTGNVYFFRYLNKLGKEASNSDHEEGHKPAHSSTQNDSIATKIVSIIVTVLGIIIGSISLIGLVSMVTTDIEPQYLLFAVSLVLVIPMILLSHLNAVFRYTVLMIGYTAGIIAIMLLETTFLSALFLILTVAGWFRLKGRKQHLFTYALINLNLAIILFQLFESFDKVWSLTILALVIWNAFVYFTHLVLPEGELQKHVQESGMFFGLLFLFWLTFLGDIFPYSYELFNLLNFAVVTSLVFLFIRRNQAWETTISLIFWFLFLGFKYYDLLWTLLHKSLTLALLGVIFLVVTTLAARRMDLPHDVNEQSSYMSRKTWLIVAVIVLQLGFLGYQTAASEHLLQNGTLVKLEIEPLDPRSLLQGDYVTLNYSITTPPESIATELKSESSQRKIKVVLTEDENGVSVFDRVYKKGEALADGEVIITGKSSGWRSIYYGIETYFVPEGTGRETEQNARFAYIRVSTNGNALLERLSDK